MLRYMNPRGSVSTSSDEAATPETEPQASSADADEEVEHDEKDKDKDIHAIDCSGRSLSQTFCMKWNIVLGVPPDVVQATTDFR